MLALFRQRRPSELPRFPMLILNFTLLFTLTTLVWLGFSIHRNTHLLEESITKNIKAAQLHGQIMRIGETLSTSAQMAIITGDQQWEDRYNHYDPLLSNAINQAILYIPPSQLDQTVNKADAINKKLSAMEQHAFDLKKTGNTEAAKHILFSPEYASLKNDFNESMTKYENLLVLSAKDNLARGSLHRTSSFTFLLTDLLALLIVWIVTYRKLSFWKKELEGKIQSEVEYKKEIEKARHFLNEVLLINKMNDRLQTCQEATEAYDIISHTAKELFPSISGALTIRHPFTDDMETVQQWGNDQCLTPQFTMEDCWALRDGHIYIVNNPNAGIYCHHFNPKPPNGYLCLPLIVQSGALGMLELSAPAKDTISDHQQQLAITFGEVLRLSLGNIMLRETLSEQATKDPLTQLYNRRYFDTAIARQLQRISYRKTTLCIAMIDIDFFKKINDKFGHDIGDEVLKQIASILRKGIRGNDLACRYGGEEFVIVMEASQRDAYTKIKQLSDEIKKIHLHFQSINLPPVTISVGLAEAPTIASTPEELIRSADEALYKAKENGRDQIVIAS